jgi:hypothetical protein
MHWTFTCCITACRGNVMSIVDVDRTTAWYFSTRPKICLDFSQNFKNFDKMIYTGMWRSWVGSPLACGPEGQRLESQLLISFFPLERDYSRPLYYNENSFYYTFLFIKRYRLAVFKRVLYSGFRYLDPHCTFVFHRHKFCLIWQNLHIFAWIWNSEYCKKSSSHFQIGVFCTYCQAIKLLVAAWVRILIFLESNFFWSYSTRSIDNLLVATI